MPNQLRGATPFEALIGNPLVPRADSTFILAKGTLLTCSYGLPGTSECKVPHYNRPTLHACRNSHEAIGQWAL
jgi:hypothetical protein